MHNIGIVWDFDGTLAPDDSTMKTVEIISSGEVSGDEFFRRVKQLKGETSVAETDWKHIQAMDAPIWMYTLSRMASEKSIPLNTEFFRTFVKPHVQLYAGVTTFLKEIKNLEKLPEFKILGIRIRHYIVTAGLKNLIELMFPKNMISQTYGCRYEVVRNAEGDLPESIPVYCMDETGKTRAIFEIAKGSFISERRSVNRRQAIKWQPFENMIYIGDGDTDIPALSLTRQRGGMGIVVYNPAMPKTRVDARLKMMRQDYRADLITPADFHLDGELFSFIKNRCIQIRHRCEARNL